MILGIDFGSSATDYVLMDNHKIITYGSDSSGISIKDILDGLSRYDIEKVNVTGGRAKKMDARVCMVNEIDAIGKGGSFVSDKKDALIVSIGSGTAMVSYRKGKARHIGGTSMGARTLIGLSKLILGTEDIQKIENMAKKGKVQNVDLMLSEIYPKGIGLLPPNATASHFGSMKKYSKEDIARGLINMIAQSIGSIAVFGAQSNKHDQIVLTGKITQMRPFKEIIKKRIADIMHVNVIIPKNAGIATAIGCALKKN